MKLRRIGALTYCEGLAPPALPMARMRPSAVGPS